MSFHTGSTVGVWEARIGLEECGVVQASLAQADDDDRIFAHAEMTLEKGVTP